MVGAILTGPFVAKTQRGLPFLASSARTLPSCPATKISPPAAVGGVSTCGASGTYVQAGGGGGPAGGLGRASLAVVEEERSLSDR